MRLIDAKEMEGGIKEAFKENPFLMGMLLRWVRKHPTIDAVPVVRCKDCKWSGMYCFGTSDYEQLACLEVEEDGFVRFATAVDADDFCSYGERRGGDGDA